MKVFLWILSVINIAFLTFFAYFLYLLFCRPTPPNASALAGYFGFFLLYFLSYLGLPLGIVNIISYGYYFKKYQAPEKERSLRIIGRIVLIFSWIIVVYVVIFFGTNFIFSHIQK